MIFFFSGTGNSYAVAKKLAEKIDECLLSMSTLDNEIISSYVESSHETQGFVFPVYAWGIPKIVKTFLKVYLPLLAQKYMSKDFLSKENMRIIGGDAHSHELFCHNPNRKQPNKTLPYIFLVLTCGDDVGMTHKEFENIFKKYGFSINACWSIQMPNTYVAFPGFNIDNTEIAEQKIAAAPTKIQEIASLIRNRRSEVCDVKSGSFPKFKSYILKPLFYKYLSSPKHFHIKDSLCSNCGCCEKVCPLHNIIPRDYENKYTGYYWGTQCTQCFACYHKCNKHAIQWGFFTKNKGQHTLTKLP